MGRTIISLIEAEYRRYKGLGEGALEQLDAQELLVHAEGVNSVATIVWHIAPTSYHVGQIVHIAKGLRASTWKYLTIPPGGSVAYNANPTLEKAAGHAQALERPRSTFPRNTQERS